ncbi:carbon-nitrogen hydrolase family protein [Sciscionella sediminilitoris]|uniref:carbon-nitrogen hydrolase family protein n=1 Tax=Sciscionella sediminilitoris TaxID=1445613 RepID=UPI0004DF147F|nr:carbon-nitrogen hydrolase family protein [Sciscionella sp. SE31]
MRTFRLACLQTAGSPGDPEANLAELDECAARAAGSGADLLVTPELFLTGYDIGDAVAELAEQPLIERAAEIARRRGIGLLAGAPLRTEQGITNAAVLLDEDGKTLAVHHKAQLFGELDRKLFVEGTEPVTIAEFHGMPIAILICYDVEFPEAVRAAALAGAKLIAVPTAQMEPFAFVAETVIPARAWENQVYVCYANHTGSERDTVYVGRSSIVAPDGEKLACAGTRPALLLAELDPERVDRAQLENPYLTDLRRDLYR